MDLPFSSKIIITPDLARKWLNRNVNNRPISVNNLNKIKTAIKEGKFLITGDSIKLDTDGNLVDGQHRLRAIVETGTPAETFVIYNIDKKAFTRIDIGRKRSGPDTLAVAGFNNCNLTAAAVALIDRYYKGTVLNRKPHTNEEILDLAKTYDVSNYVVLWNRCRYIIEPSLGVSCQYLFDRVMDNEQVRHWLIDQVCEGINLEPDSPAHVLHKRLLLEFTGKARMPREYKFAFVIKAFNAMATGQNIKAIRFCTTGVKPEVFPEIYNLKKGERNV